MYFINQIKRVVKFVLRMVKSVLRIFLKKKYSLYIIRQLVRLAKQQGKRGVFQVFVFVSLAFIRMWGRSLYQKPFFLSFFKSPFLNKKKCIYTVLTGNYDDLSEPEFVTPGWDYICVTDNKELTSPVWKFVYIEDSLGLDYIRLARYYKCFNHLIDSDYDISIYIDANIKVLGNLDYFLMISYDINMDYATLFHTFAFSVKQELDLCIAYKKDNDQVMMEQVESYRSLGFSDMNAHINSRLIIRRCGSPSVKLMMESWFQEIKNGSYRDQLSFSPVLDRHSEVSVSYIEFWKFLDYFELKKHKNLKKQ